jgi:putative DNA primase/helicase
MPGKSSTRKSKPAKLPAALAPMMARPNWMTWRPVQRNGRVQKPPCQASNPRRFADYTNPDHRSDYVTARAAVEAGNANGLTYATTEGDELAAIDLDNCRDADTGSIDPWAKRLLKGAKGAYVEISPSGTGLHVWGLTSNSTDKLHSND